VVVNAIEVQQHPVAPVAEVREEHEVLGHGVEHVAMQHQVAPAQTLVDVVLDDAQVLEVEREERREDVIVVARR